jgi:PmbA protein
VTLAVNPDTGLDVATDAVARAIKAGADEAKVMHSFSEMFEVNFDTHDVTLVRTTVGDTMAITVYEGTRKGTAQLTGRAHDAVESAVEQALASARAGEPDPANVLPTEPVEPAPSSGHEAPDQDAMVDAVLRHIARTKDEYPALRSDSSMYKFTNTWTSYANSHDRVQHARQGRYGITQLVTAKEGTTATSFNFVVQISESPLGELTDLPLVRRTYDTTMSQFGAHPIPATFVGDVIFTPEALDTLTDNVVGALSGISLMRKTTPFLDRLGSAIASPSFSLLHRPSELAGAPAFDGEGFVNRDIDLIKDGVLENFVIDWYFSRKLDRPRTTSLTNLAVAPGDTTLDEIIASTERGIVLGYYSGGTPNQKLDFSGVAKNSFYVEDGKIVHPITETMIAGNFVSLLESIKAVSRETLDLGAVRFPWVAASGVTISTK